MKNALSVLLIAVAMQFGLQHLAWGDPAGEEAGFTTVKPAAARDNEPHIQRWRKTKIRSIWNRLHFTLPPLTEPEAQSILKSQNGRGIDPSDDTSAYFLSGEPFLGNSPAGMLIAGSAGNYWPHCTVVLTRPDVVLTARHCVESLPDTSDFMLYFPREGFRAAADDGVSVFCEDDDGHCSYRSDDLAAIRLDVPYSFTPIARKADTDTVTPTVAAWAQGYGDSSLVLSDRGILKAGPVEIHECACGNGDFENSGHICTPVDYEGGRHPPGYFVVYGGNSGSPLFSANDKKFRLLGIASRLSRVCSEPSSHEGRYVDLRVARYNTWLSRQAFCDPPCSSDAPGDYAELLRVLIGYVSSGSVDFHPISIPQKTTRLLVTLNHEINGFQPEPVGDLDIAMPGSLAAECTRYYGLESCEVHYPPPGDYSIGIKTITGNPAYQLTAVAVRSGE